MAKEKRSFFEKLTGTAHFDETEESMPAPKRGAAIKKQGADKGEEWVEEDGQLTVDVYQTPSDIVIKAMISGVNPNTELDIAISRDMVTIKGKREETHDVQEEDYFYRELYWGSFSRTIMLPQEVEPEEAEASEKNGLLTLRLPKIDKHRQTKLKVQTNN